MDRSPSSEAESRSAGRMFMIFRFSGSPQFHYCVHKSLSLNPILSQLNPIHTLNLFLENPL